MAAPTQATINVVNNLSVDIFLGDIGFLIPASQTVLFGDQRQIFILMMSKDFRLRVNAGDFTLNDGSTNVTLGEMYNSYWSRACWTTDKSDPARFTYLKSPDGSTWEISVDDLGVLSTRKL